MFEGESADTCARKFPLESMGGRAEGLACADPGARTPIGASGIELGMYKIYSFKCAMLNSYLFTVNKYLLIQIRRVFDNYKNQSSC